jgi:carboxyl-terminal processing protease
LDGKPQSDAVLEVLDEKNERRAFSIKRETEKAEYSLPIGNFPPQAVEFEARRLEKGVGYIRFNIWVMPQLAKIRNALKTMSDAPGIVFDLRGNPGGLGVLAAGIAGNLVSEQTSLGSLKFRSAEQKFLAYPQADAYKGKIVVLTDGGSASTSEIFAAGLQESGRARVVGETSMGAVLASIFDRLPTNAIFQYAISDYKSPKNILIEGRGVKPDVEVRLTRESLLEGRDLQLEAAAAEILK